MTLTASRPETPEDVLSRLVDTYSAMASIRAVEERLLGLFNEGVLTGTVHTSIGQEPTAVGVVGALERSRDVVWSNHRGHGHFLTFCDDVEGLIAELLGRETGVCKGIGGSQHLHVPNYYSNGILGGIAPCAVGSAMAEKVKNSGAVVVVFLGDGAMAEGAVAESLNMSALWKLPVLFVLEHNGYAQSTPTALEHAGELATRGLTYGIATTEIASNDVFEIRDKTLTIVDRMRNEPQPHFLALETIRLMPHSKGDDTRSVEELSAIQERDPLVALRAKVDEVDERRRHEIDQEISVRIEAAVDAALAAPAMNPRQFMQESKTW